MENTGSRVFVNDRLHSKMVVIDRKPQAVIGNWPIYDAKLNVAMALDEAGHRLFVGCRSGKIVVFNTVDGTQTTALAIGEGVDDLTFDASSKRVLAATGAGAGSLHVFQQLDPDHYQAVGEMASAPGGKNGIYVPRVHRYFVGVPQHDTADTSILVFDVH